MRSVIRTFSVQTAKGALAALFVVFSFNQASAFQGRMEKVSIVQCGANSCATVTASSADVSWMSANLSLRQAKLTLKEFKGKTRSYTVDDLYFDNAAQRIYLHGVAELKNAEAFYDLKAEKLTVFAN